MTNASGPPLDPVVPAPSAGVAPISAARFEARHADAWNLLEASIGRAGAGQAFDAAQLAQLYRGVSGQLALARSRGYPAHLTERLERLAQDAHRLIYRRSDYGLARLGELVLVDIPVAVRALRGCLAIAAALFVLALALSGWAAWRDPGFILHQLTPAEVAQFEGMYGPEAEELGRTRDAGDDWAMFGFYARHNTDIAVRCFGAGLFAGIGSAVVLFYNGVHIGAVAGYLVAAGHAHNFFTFVSTHSAFELTALVLAGAAGLRLGVSWVVPGRRSRLSSLQHAARAVVPVVYAFMLLLSMAAALEAFWSAAPWVAPAVKYGLGAALWALVLLYFGLQGRPRKLAPGAATGPAAARRELRDAR